MSPTETVFDISCSMGVMYVSALCYSTVTRSETRVNSFDLVRAPDAYSRNIEDLRDVQSINAAVQTIYEDARRLLQDTMYLKQHRNSLSGYGSLPDEILVKIFRWCLKKRETADDQCYAFSQVCRRWRSASITEKTLWTTPDLLHPYLAKEMYKNRTADLPLHIHFPDLFQQATYHRDVVLRFPSGISERTQSIDVSYSRIGYDEDFSTRPDSAIRDFFDRSDRFPMLESLSLRSGDKYSREPFNWRKDAPLLRSVTLENCLFRWSSSFLENLTSLIIVLRDNVYSRVDQNHPPILDLLRRNPNLETLVLKDVMSRARQVTLDPPTSDDITPIEFAHLKSLEVCDDMENIVPLIPLLKIPLASKVEFQADLTAGPLFRTHALLARLGEASVKFLELNGWATKFHAITMTLDYNRSYVHLRETKPGRGDLFEMIVGRPINYHMDHTHAWSKVLATTLLAPHVDLVSCKWGKEARHMPMDYLCAALAKLPALKTLEVSDESFKPQIVEDLLAHLTPRTPDDPDAPQTFPALWALYIIEIEMFKEVSQSQRESVFEKLESVLGRRKKAGENIPRATWLNECSFVEPLEVVLAAKNRIKIWKPRIVETSSTRDVQMEV